MLLYNSKHPVVHFTNSTASVQSLDFFTLKKLLPTSTGKKNSNGVA